MLDVLDRMTICALRPVAAGAALALLFAPIPAFGAAPIEPAAPPPQPTFDRLHDFDEVSELLAAYAAAYPDWVELESIGKSGEGRDMWLVTLSNPATGAPETKPAVYVDGNTHANEVQGTEVVLWVLDFVLSRYGRLETVTELADRATFYLVPVVNPDGRARWFAGPSTSGFPRTVMVPVDDDRDGLTDEDPFDDLDGDGVITQMRKRVPLGQGDQRLDPDDPRILEPAPEGELGDWVMLGSEGIDNDGDGMLNEDPVGYVDPNRTWGFGWQPPYVESGAGPYPLSIPETRSIALWAMEHPNIAAAQSFHNSGGMILRGPGAKSDPPYAPDDLKAYDLIAEEGERMIPGYRYLITWRDLYTAYGSTMAHFYSLVGAITFTNEMYREETVVDADGDGEISQQERMRFNDLLTLGRQFSSWKEVDHPQYGKVEVGGYRHDVGRVPEGWLLSEEIHRNGAFVLFHARHLPRLEIAEPRVEQLEGRLWRLEIPVINHRAIPSVTAVARTSKLHRQDLATIDGARVVASGVMTNPLLGQVDLQRHRPERLLVPGIPGIGSRTLFFLVEGKGEVTFTYDSLKAGTHRRTLSLEPTAR